MPDSTLTTNRVAAALGVSESSVKRWCDTGKIASTKTPGGHRRVSVDSVYDFVRAGHAQIARAELLGLPTLPPKAARDLSACRELMREALIAGDEQRCRQLLWDLHLAGHRMSELCDEVLAGAFREIGDRWDCRAIEVYHERRACEICMRLLYDIRRGIPVHSPTAPIAIGCSPDGDPYSLPSQMIELVLRQGGWNAQSLGTSVPLSSLAAAAREMRPRLVWLSVSQIADADRFVAEYREFHACTAPLSAIVVGGRALDESIRRLINFASYGDNFCHLESFATTLYREAPSTF